YVPAAADTHAPTAQSAGYGAAGAWRNAHVLLFAGRLPLSSICSESVALVDPGGDHLLGIGDHLKSADSAILGGFAARAACGSALAARLERSRLTRHRAGRWIRDGTICAAAADRAARTKPTGPKCGIAWHSPGSLPDHGDRADGVQPLARVAAGA